MHFRSALFVCWKLELDLSFRSQRESSHRLFVGEFWSGITSGWAVNSGVAASASAKPPRRTHFDQTLIERPCPSGAVGFLQCSIQSTSHASLFPMQRPLQHMLLVPLILTSTASAYGQT